MSAFYFAFEPPATPKEILNPKLLTAWNEYQELSRKFEENYNDYCARHKKALPQETITFKSKDQMGDIIQGVNKTYQKVSRILQDRSQRERKWVPILTSRLYAVARRILTIVGAVAGVIFAISLQAEQ